MINSEINGGSEYIGYKQALDLVLANTNPKNIENLSIFSCIGHIVANDVFAFIDSPMNDISLKDGFAVKASDVLSASPQHPAVLNLIGTQFAGIRSEVYLMERQAVKVCSGSLLPEGADAVVSAEFGEEIGPEVKIKAEATIGLNVVHAGEDVKKGSLILRTGEVLLPARLALTAASGKSYVSVYTKPRVALIAIGDELIIPGKDLERGQVYASNMVNIAAWLSSLGMSYTLAATSDDVESIRQELFKCLNKVDAIITSGGARESESDIAGRALHESGWKNIFRHVRVGPGKRVSFGVWEGKPVFCLPGGPLSNEIAFLQLTLPGLLHLAGFMKSPFQSISARLTQNISGRHPAWTEFYKAKLLKGTDGYPSVIPYSGPKRLYPMVNYMCLIRKPEGIEDLYRGQIMTVRILIPNIFSLSMEDY